MKVCLLIPILNERETLQSELHRLLSLQNYCRKNNLEFLISDGGSEDGSLEFLQENELNFVTKNLERPTIARTLLAPKEHIKSEYVLIAPIDCCLQIHHLKLAEKSIQKGQYGGFIKNYDSPTWALKLQASYLNLWRLQIARHFVWTNCPIIPKDLFFSFLKQDNDFLSDVFLARKLKDSDLSFVVFKSSVTCSSRRYHHRGVLKQMVTNFLVLVGERMGVAPQTLKRLYSA